MFTIAGVVGIILGIFILIFLGCFVQAALEKMNLIPGACNNVGWSVRQPGERDIGLLSLIPQLREYPPGYPPSLSGGASGGDMGGGFGGNYNFNGGNGMTDYNSVLQQAYQTTKMPGEDFASWKARVEASGFLRSFDMAYERGRSMYEGHQNAMRKQDEEGLCVGVTMKDGSGYQQWWKDGVMTKERKVR